MHGSKTMFDLLMVIVRWLVVLFRGGYTAARSEYCPAPVGVNSGRRRSECFPAGSPCIGWMTMRLDPVRWVDGWSNYARARRGSAPCTRSPSQGGT